MKKMNSLFLALGACLALVAAEGEKIPAVYTVPHELDVLVKAGHIQGATCSEQGIYLAHQLGIEKIGWDGKLITRVEAPAHLGDICCANGKIYGAFAIRGRKTKDELPGLVRVWNEELEQVAEKRFPVNLDGCCVLGDTLYVGEDPYGHKPHPGCRIRRLGLDLSEKDVVDVDIGYPIHYGVQTMATDGHELFLGNYGARADAGNPKRYNCTRLTADLKPVQNLSFSCSEGFGRVPKSIAKRDTPVFFTVKAMGGNMQGWRKDPVNNPPRIRLDFYEYKNGVFTDITDNRKRK